MISKYDFSKSDGAEACGSDSIEAGETLPTHANSSQNNQSGKDYQMIYNCISSPFFKLYLNILNQIQKWQKHIL